MKWGQRFDQDDEVPEELRGKSPKEVADALRAADKSKTDAAAAEAARAAAEAASTAKDNELAEMRQRMQALEANQRPNDPPPPDEPPSPWTDPEKFVAAQTQGTTNVALAAGLMSAKMYFTQGLTPRDQKIFRKYEKEVEQGVNTFAATARVMPQSWMNMFLYVKGLHEQDIQKAEADHTDFFAETASRGSHNEPEPQDKLTPEEEEVCQTFHYDPVAYLANKKNSTLSTSSKGSYAKYTVPVRAARS
jgi:hypothetical protein